MINTVLKYENETFILSFYNGDIMINGKVIVLKLPQYFDSNEKQMVEKLKQEGVMESLALFTVSIDSQLCYKNVVFKWLLTRLLYILYNRRNIIIGGWTVYFNNDNLLTLGNNRIQLDRNKLIEQGKRIFGY